MWRDRNLHQHSQPQRNQEQVKYLRHLRHFTLRVTTRRQVTCPSYPKYRGLMRRLTHSAWYQREISNYRAIILMNSNYYQELMEATQLMEIYYLKPKLTLISWWIPYWKITNNNNCLKFKISKILNNYHISMTKIKNIKVSCMMR